MFLTGKTGKFSEVVENHQQPHVTKALPWRRSNSVHSTSLQGVVRFDVDMRCSRQLAWVINFSTWTGLSDVIFDIFTHAMHASKISIAPYLEFLTHRGDRLKNYYEGHATLEAQSFLANKSAGSSLGLSIRFPSVLTPDHP